MSEPDDLLEGDELAWLALTGPARAPSEALRARLQASVARTHRFEGREAQVAELLDITPAQAAELLLAIDEPSSWGPGMASDIELFHVTGGPAVADAVTGFVRMAPGTLFPEHEHVGDETVLLLQGSCRDASGEVFGPGQIAAMRAGSRHHFHAVGAVRLVFLAVVHGGLVVDGVTIGPGDPRG